MNGAPRIWVLMGDRRGDNNQLLALAEGLGLPFETRTMDYRWHSKYHRKIFRSSIGQRTVPVARWIRHHSGGRARLVRLGHPRAPNRLFDLVITTPQYPVPPADNVITLPLAMNRFRAPPEPTCCCRSAERRQCGSSTLPL